MIYNNFYPLFTPFLPPFCEKPPTIYSILNSIVNGDKEEDEYSKIKDLAKLGRTTIFDFDYPLTNKISKEKFETMILNNFLMRRIGFETVTAFKIKLDVKLNEIMPLYNKMFEALDGWDIFEDGETMSRTGFDNTTSETKSENKNLLNTESENIASNTSDRRNSELPQNRLDDLRNGSYVTDYNYDTNDTRINDTSESRGITEGTTNLKDNKIYNETIKRSPSDKITIMKDMQENIKSIYTLIFKDLEPLFYGLV